MMPPRPSSDAIKERAYQFWEKQKATEAQRMPVAIQKGRIPRAMASSIKCPGNPRHHIEGESPSHGKGHTV